MIERLVAALRAADKDLDWRDLADVLWLSYVTGPLPADDRVPATSPDAATHDDTAKSATTWDISESTAEGAPATGPQPALRRASTSEGEGLTLDVRPPAHHALPGRLEIGRALRPFKKSRQSRHDWVFDTEATIEHYCDTKVLVPISVPARERWFADVALVVDGGRTMVVWRETVAALADLLERHGAFGRVTRWTLVGNDGEVHVESATGLRHDPHALIDYDGRRLTLVVTDCVSMLWRGSAAWAALRDWGHFAPVALVQTLPARLWPATALGDADVAMASHRRGEPNRQLRLRPPWWWEGEGPPEQATPVVTLDERRMGAWARMVMGAGGVEVAGVLTQPPHSADPGIAAAPVDAQARVATFRATVSEEAARLATLLSAVDVSLPIARLVLNALIPDARQTHLAEVFVGGLLQPTALAGDPSSADTYDFVPGVREILQESLTTTATIDVWRTVAPYLEVATGQRPPFSVLLTPDAQAPPYGAASALGRIATDLINRLGMTDPPQTAAVGNGSTAVSATTTGANSPTGIVAAAPARPTLQPGPDATVGEALRRHPESPEPVSGPRRLALQFVGVAVSSYGDPSFPPLPHAIIDVRAIAEVFTRAGTQAEMVVDPTAAEAHQQLQSLFHGSEAAVVYWVGHAARQERELRLIARDTGASARAFDTVRAISIIESALNAGVRQLMLIFDTRVDGASAEPILSAQLGDLASSLDSDCWIGVLATSQSYEGSVRRLADAVLKLLREGPSSDRAHWSAHNEAVRGIDFLDALRQECSIGPQQTWLATFGQSTPVLPNLCYAPGARDRPAESLILAGRGVVPGEDGWYFTGRRRILAEIVEWLRAAHPGQFVVTGPAGAGKSALLGRIASLSDPAERAVLAAHGALEAGDIDPGEGAVDAVLYAHGHSHDSLVTELARRLGAGSVVSLHGVLGHIVESGRHPVVLVDALDEVEDVDLLGLIRDLLIPLSSQALVLIGTRARYVAGGRTLVDLLGEHGVVVDLADVPDTEKDIAHYVARRLEGTGNVAIPQIAAAVAHRAVQDGGFLYARLVTSRLRTHPVDTSLDGWQEQISERIIAGFNRDLGRLDDDSQRSPNLRRYTVSTAWEREQERERKARYLDEREAETRRLNELITQRLADLENILSAGLSRSFALDHNARKLPLPVFDAGGLDRASTEPTLEDFLPHEPGTFARLIPGWKGRHEKQQISAQVEFSAAHTQWQHLEEERRKQLTERRNRHQQAVGKVREQNLRMDELAVDARTGKQYAVEDYVRHALKSSIYPKGFPAGFGLRYLPSRNDLLMEYEFPVARDIVPAETIWRYIKTRDAIESKPITATGANKIYKSVLAQVTLRTLYEVFTADTFGHISTVFFNGFVKNDDPTTGRPIRPRLVSLRADRDEYLDRDFSRLDPVKALQSLRANFSPAPTELLPVPAVVEFDVNDPRFIEEQDIISGLDERTNLVELTPDAFEQLITNLFNRMGFDAHATRTSKDGGVDCIAFYKKSIVGGKYVIQAKRWTNTVQVDAVRDLFGAMDHERANKGILITTSKFAPACWKFADGKPMELIDGNSLLALIEEHTQLKVKIVLPPRKP
jgi:restriction system protein